MIWIILGFIASYIIGVIMWSIFIIVGKPADTYDELREELCDSPAFFPFINIIFAVGLLIFAIIILIVAYIYKYCGIEKLWNKIKDKKLPFRK